MAGRRRLPRRHPGHCWVPVVDMEVVNGVHIDNMVCEERAGEHARSQLRYLLKIKTVGDIDAVDLRTGSPNCELSDVCVTNALNVKRVVSFNKVRAHIEPKYDQY